MPAAPLGLALVSGLVPAWVSGLGLASALASASLLELGLIWPSPLGWRWVSPLDARSRPASGARRGCLACTCSVGRSLMASRRRTVPRQPEAEPPALWDSAPIAATRSR